MKKILCFGDSNTYGYIPGTGKRYSKSERWSGILSELLVDYEVIEEGMNNRKGFFSAPESIEFCGIKYLPICLKKHSDINICILALGTNDSQFFFNLNSDNAEIGLQTLIDSIHMANKNSKIIIVPPVKITENILKTHFSMMFNKSSIEKIQEIFPIFKEVALKNNCLYLDFNEFVRPSEIDGLHYEKESHKIIAQTLAELIIKVM